MYYKIMAWKDENIPISIINNLVRIVDGIEINTKEVTSSEEFVASFKAQSEISINKFNRLKKLLTKLEHYKNTFTSPIEVDRLDKQVARTYTNIISKQLRMARLLKYILASIIAITNGDNSYIDDLMPTNDFFERCPNSKKSQDVIYAAICNEQSGKFITEQDPKFKIRNMVLEILQTKASSTSDFKTTPFTKYRKAFDDSIYYLTWNVMEAFFNFNTDDNTKDIMRHFEDPHAQIRFKIITDQNIDNIQNKIDHSLTCLNRAVQDILDEVRRNPSFVQFILNNGFISTVQDNVQDLSLRFGKLESFLNILQERKQGTINVCYNINERTTPSINIIKDQLQDIPTLKKLLLQVREAQQEGDIFFRNLHALYDYYYQLAIKNGYTLDSYLKNIEDNLEDLFDKIKDYLIFIPVLEAKINNLQKNFEQFTLVEENQSEFYQTLYPLIPQIKLNFSNSQEKGKSLLKYVNKLEEFETLYDTLLGTPLKNILKPVLKADISPTGIYNMHTFVSRNDPDPANVLYIYFRRIMNINMYSQALFAFFGDPTDDESYPLEINHLKVEFKRAKEKLQEILEYCADFLKKAEQASST
ncbi:hypothetical protein ACFL5G_05135 [Candidatus Margulisiibacteriota bacterium]